MYEDIHRSDNNSLSNSTVHSVFCMNTVCEAPTYRFMMMWRPFSGEAFKACLLGMATVLIYSSTEIGLSVTLITVISFVIVRSVGHVLTTVTSR